VRRQQAAKDGAEWNRMDALSLDIHRRVREGYLKMIEAQPERWKRIPAVGEQAAIQEQIRAVVLSRLPTPSQ